MKFLLATGVYLIMAVILGLGMLQATHGSWWLFWLSVIGFSALLGRFCLAK